MIVPGRFPATDGDELVRIDDDGFHLVRVRVSLRKQQEKRQKRTGSGSIQTAVATLKDPESCDEGGSLGRLGTGKGWDRADQQRLAAG